MNQKELINCAICIVIGILLYSFIKDSFCGKKDLIEGFLGRRWSPQRAGSLCDGSDGDCNGWTGKYKFICGREDHGTCKNKCIPIDNSAGDYNRNNCGLPNWGK